MSAVDTARRTGSTVARQKAALRLEPAIRPWPGPLPACRGVARMYHLPSGARPDLVRLADLFRRRGARQHALHPARPRQSQFPAGDRSHRRSVTDAGEGAPSAARPIPPSSFHIIAPQPPCVGRKLRPEQAWRNSVGEIGMCLLAVFRAIRAALTHRRYRPELHYMRGPGPKWFERHGR